MFSVKIHNSIERVKKSDWDRVSQNHGLLQYGWIKAIEQTLSESFTPWYPMLYENDEPVAAMALRQINMAEGEDSFDFHLFGRLYPFFSFLGISSLPTIDSMPLKGYPALFLSVPDSNPSRVLNRLQTLLTSIQDRSWRAKRSIAFTRVVGDDLNAMRLLRLNNYARMIAPPLAYLDIVWPTFRAYRQDRMRLSKNTRKKIAREINHNQKAGVSIVVLDHLDGYEDELYRLIKLNAVKHNPAAAFYTHHFFHVLKANVKRGLRLYTAFKNNQMVGMSLFLADADIWHSLFVGIDHEIDGNDLTYFNITYYRPIRDAIETRCKRINFGNSMYTLKIRLGCQLVPVSVFFRPYRHFSRVWTKPYLFLHRSINKAKYPPIVRQNLKSWEAGN